MQELLSFFEKAGATTSSTGNVRIAFDFKDARTSFGFDLRSFRTWQEAFRQATSVSRRTMPVWSYDSLVQLQRLLQTPSSEHKLSRGSLRGARASDRWLAAYRNERIWPRSKLTQQPGADPYADVIASIWQVWLEIVEASQAEGRSRRALSALTWAPNMATVIPGINRWTLKLLDVHDWAGDVAAGLASIAQRQADATDAVQAIAKLLSNRPVATVTVSISQQVKVVEELLSLPAWEHRHDLYAAWVGARIVRELDELTTIHSVNGELRYAFSGSHIATMVGPSGVRAHLVAELRSPLASPIGKSRKGRIQPDYSLQLEPFTHHERSILVVECKQYLKAAKRSFTAALIDYLRGRPNAVVVLVNYGPASAALVDGVGPELRSRACVIGNFRPHRDSSQTLEDFSNVVRAAAAGLLAAPMLAAPSRSDSDNPLAGDLHAAVADEPARTPEGDYIRLEWDVSPSDLDLHVWTLFDGVTTWHHVSYENSGALDEPPFARLDADHREGHGTELIEIVRARRIYCAVHNFSAESFLRGSGARLFAQLGGSSISLVCPESGEGVWWKAFAFDFRTRLWSVDDCLVATQPTAGTEMMGLRGSHR